MACCKIREDDMTWRITLMVDVVYCYFSCPIFQTHVFEMYPGAGKTPAMPCPCHACQSSGDIKKPEHQQHHDVIVHSQNVHGWAFYNVIGNPDPFIGMRQCHVWWNVSHRKWLMCISFPEYRNLMLISLFEITLYTYNGMPFLFYSVQSRLLEHACNASYIGISSVLIKQMLLALDHISWNGIISLRTAAPIQRLFAIECLNRYKKYR